MLPTRATCPLRPASAADRPNRTRRTTARKGNRRQGGVEVHSGGLGCHCSALASTLVFCLGGYITKTPQPPQGGMSIRRADEVVKHVTVRGSSISTSLVCISFNPAHLLPYSGELWFTQRAGWRPRPDHTLRGGTARPVGTQRSVVPARAQRAHKCAEWTTPAREFEEGLY